MALIPIYWWNKEVHNFRISQDKFSKQPWANGVVLLVCVLVAMLLANLPFTKQVYHDVLETQLTMNIKSPDGLIDWAFPRGMTVEKFINDILMVIFFFTVGLEIKREVVCGELSSFKKAILPVIAAFGGVVVPALIYTLVNHGTLAGSGWGIPTATDIAFAVGILSILGDKVPVSLKVFLTALAIADDLIAILVVALFYGGHVNGVLLLIALAVIAFVFLMKNQMSQRLQKALLGFASGVMVAASVWSLLIPAMQMEAEKGAWSVWPAAAGFLLGMGFLLLIDELTPHLHIGTDKPEGMRAHLSKTAMLALAVTIHNLPEGMAVGVVFAGAENGSAHISLASAVAVSIGIAIQNIPEGAIISMPMRAAGNSRWRSFLLGSLSGAVEPVGAVAVLLLASLLMPVLPYMLSFAAGAMFYVVIEELIPEASAGKHSNLSTIGFAIGFVLMMVLDVVMG